MIQFQIVRLNKLLGLIRSECEPIDRKKRIALFIVGISNKFTFPLPVQNLHIR